MGPPDQGSGAGRGWHHDPAPNLQNSNSSGVRFRSSCFVHRSAPTHRATTGFRDESSHRRTADTSTKNERDGCVSATATVQQQLATTRITCARKGAFVT